MAEIKIKDLNALQQISKGQQEYQQKMTDYFKSSTNKFEEKIGTSESEAIKIYVEFLNEMKTNLTTKHPENIKKVSDVILKYYNSVTSATFSNDVISKNIDVYIGKTKGENVQQIITPAAEAANYLSSITGSDYSIWGKIDEFNQEMGAISTDISNKHEELTTYQITLKSELEESSILLEADKLYIQQVKTFASYDGRQAIDRIDALLRQGWTKDQIILAHKNTTTPRDLKILSYLAEEPPNYDNIVKELYSSVGVNNYEDLKDYIIEQYLNGQYSKAEYDAMIALADADKDLFIKALLGLVDESDLLAATIGFNDDLIASGIINGLLASGLVSGLHGLKEVAIRSGIGSILTGVVTSAYRIVINGEDPTDVLIEEVIGQTVIWGCGVIGASVGTLLGPAGTVGGGIAGTIVGSVINKTVVQPIVIKNKEEIKRIIKIIPSKKIDHSRLNLTY